MKNEEYNLQKKCVQWFNYQYPKQQGLLYMNFNNPKNKINGALMKAAGMVAGVSDLTYLHKGQAYFIELKTPQGRMSEKQKLWESQVTGALFPYSVVREFSDFVGLIKEINK